MAQFSNGGMSPSERLENYLSAEKEFSMLYKAGKNAGDEAQMEEARNLHKDLVKQLATDGQDYVQMFRLIKQAHECKRDIPDLHDCIWENQIPKLVDIFRKFSIACFTVSSGYSSMNKTIWDFTQQPGVRLMGMTEIVTNPVTGFGKNEPDKEPAFLFYIG